MVRRNIVRWRRSQLMALTLLLGPIRGWAEPALYSTWANFEADKCASLWLIKRFIDPTATFRFYPSGVRIDQGIAFDTPDAPFRRTHNQSTFERLLDHYAFRNPTLLDLGRLLHDIEINTWAPILPETVQLLKDLEPWFAKNENPHATSAFCLDYFDRYYARRNSPPPGPSPSNAAENAEKSLRQPKDE